MKIVVAIYSPFRAWCIPDASLDRLRECDFAGMLGKAEEMVAAAEASSQR